MLKKRKAVVLFLLIIGFISIIGIFRLKEVTLNQKLSITDDLMFNVSKGESYKSLINDLSKQNVLKNNFFINNLWRVYPPASSIREGTYLIKPGSSLSDLLQMINEGKVYQFSITLIDGETYADWIKQLEKNKYLKHTLNALSEEDVAKKLGTNHHSLEGLLLPNTYFFTSQDSDYDIIKRAYLAMNVFLDKVWKNRVQSDLIKTKYQALILASLIEKETGIADEKKLVSSVFYNRLKKNMRLQTDPTVIYGLGKKYNGKLTSKNLKTVTPYNTYIIRGLPPTPIAMPNKSSILAALHPDKTKYLYFVATGHGGHTFTTNYKEHVNAVKKYYKTLKNEK